MWISLPPKRIVDRLVDHAFAPQPLIEAEFRASGRPYPVPVRRRARGLPHRRAARFKHDAFDALAKQQCDRNRPAGPAPMIATCGVHLVVRFQHSHPCAILMDRAAHGAGGSGFSSLWPEMDRLLDKSGSVVNDLERKRHPWHHDDK